MFSKITFRAENSPKVLEHCSIFIFTPPANTITSMKNNSMPLWPVQQESEDPKAMNSVTNWVISPRDETQFTGA